MAIEIKLNATVPGSNSTQREHLEQNLPDHEWLKPFEMSRLEEYFMSVFWQLDRDRQHSMMGTPKRLTLQTFVYYQQLFDDKLNTDEIKVLQTIDDAYLKAKFELTED